MPDANKSIKVDSAVHSELRRLKSQYNVSTYNDVLRRELSIVPDAEVEKLAAYMPPDLREAAKNAAETIVSVDGFEREVEEDSNGTYLQFISSDSGRKIAEIKFYEESFRVNYRDQHGEMSRCGGGVSRDGSVYRTTGGYHDSTTQEDILDSIEEKVTGAYRRWK